MRRRAFLTNGAATLALPMTARATASRVLKFIPATDLTTLDPIWTGEYRTRNHAYMVFDTLYGQTGPERGFIATPQMVAGHTIEDDGLTWKLTLREGRAFHDGQPVLARDCVASIQRWSRRDAFGQALMQRTDELRADDDRVIRFRLKQPFPLLPDALGKARASKKPLDQGGWSLLCSAFSGIDLYTPANNPGLRGNGGAAWFAWPISPILERSRDAWFAAPDLASQKQIAATMQTQALHDVPHYPLGQYFRLSAFRSDLTGILHGVPVFWNTRRV
jgi:hypothetical protein